MYFKVRVNMYRTVFVSSYFLWWKGFTKIFLLCLVSKGDGEFN